MRQLSLLDDANLAGLIPTLRAAMNRAAGEDADGRKLLVDKINSVARAGNLRLVGGNARFVTKEILDKWLAPADKDHVPSLLAVLVFCKATGDHTIIDLMARGLGLGLGLATEEDMRMAAYGRACVEEKQARKRKRLLEEKI